MDEMNLLLIIGDLEVQNRRLKFEIEQLKKQVQQLSKDDQASKHKTD